MSETKKDTDRVSINFSNKQMFNRREITKDGEKIGLVSVSLPSTSQFSGYYIDVTEKFVHKSSFNDKMSFTSYKKGSTVPIYKYDKETGEKERVEISVDALKDEFNSWKNRENRDKNNKENETDYEASNDENDNMDDIDVG